MLIGMNESKEFNLLRNLTLKIKPTKIKDIYLPTYIAQPTYFNINFDLFWSKFKMPHNTFVLCHVSQSPSKIHDEDPLSIFKTKKFQTFFICHMSSCKLLIFTVIYKWHIIIYKW
jgi:hypothetical protein